MKYQIKQVLITEENRVFIDSYIVYCTREELDMKIFERAFLLENRCKSSKFNIRVKVIKLD